MSTERSRDHAGWIEVTWLERESKGYIDILPIECFSEEGHDDVIVHDVRGPQGGGAQAKCRITLGGQRADLDYASFPAFNEVRGMYLGVMRILFADIDRTAVREVRWKDRNASEFSVQKVTVALTPAAVVSPYRGPDGRKGTKVQRLVQERPGQIEFRRTLKSVYGNKCCISDCTVAEALDGAPIDRYDGPGSNHQQNGLLLRRDVHALFDAGLLAIEPESRLVYLAPDARDWDGYRAWHGKKLLSNPLGGEANAPAHAALLRRWSKFVKRFEPQLTVS